MNKERIELIILLNLVKPMNNWRMLDSSEVVREENLNLIAMLWLELEVKLQPMVVAIIQVVIEIIMERIGEIWQVMIWSWGGSKRGRGRDLSRSCLFAL